MKYPEYRHVHFEFSNGSGIAIRTNKSIEQLKHEILRPECWRFGNVPEIVNAYVAYW